MIKKMVCMRKRQVLTVVNKGNLSTEQGLETIVLTCLHTFRCY